MVGLTAIFLESTIVALQLNNKKIYQIHILTTYVFLQGDNILQELYPGECSHFHWVNITTTLGELFAETLM